MSYINYIETQFPTYTVVDELDINTTGNNTIIYKNLANGVNYEDTRVQPIQLILLTTDISQGMSDMVAFAQAQSNSYYIEDLEYYKQEFYTPFCPTTFQEVGTNYTHSIYLTGQLVISSNVSDITKVEIDGYEYITSQRNLLYKTVPNTLPSDLSNRIGETNINSSNVQFTMSMVNKNNDLSTKISRIRQGSLDVNTEFTVKLTFSDNERTETYSMKLMDSTMNADNTNAPVISLTFGR